MSEEFRYIPYSPYDMNLKGLIKDGGVYNLKYAEASGKGLSGILLPGFTLRELQVPPLHLDGGE